MAEINKKDMTERRKKIKEFLLTDEVSKKLNMGVDLDETIPLIDLLTRSTNTLSKATWRLGLQKLGLRLLDYVKGCQK